MAVFESRPYRTASASSVDLSIFAVDPDSPLDQLATTWTPGTPIKLRASASLGPEFWAATGLQEGYPISLVCVVTCLPARASWRGSEVIRPTEDGGWGTSADVEVDGAVVADQIAVDAWIAGPGLTFSTDRSIHHGAKLWQAPQTLTLSLSDSRSAFPTSVVSFSAADRRPRVPWLIETRPDAEPGWTIDAAVRLLLNRDLSSAAALAEGRAPESIYALIQADIRIAAIRCLWEAAEGMSEEELLAIASDQHNSVAALAVNAIRAMGLGVREAFALLQDSPALLEAYARESAFFYRTEEPQP